MPIEELLIIRHAQTAYALPTSQVNQILRVPALTPLPLSPDAVTGLCAVGGNIVTVVDLNRVLRLGTVERDTQSARMLTLSAPNDHLALLVSEVADSVEVDPEDFEAIDQPEDAVCALYRTQDEIVQVLDLARLTSGLRLRPYDTREIKSGVDDRTAIKAAADPSERFLLFKMAQERFAIDIDLLREIIVAERPFTEITGARPEVRGMISLRDTLLLVVDLRRYYGFDGRIGDKSRILVATIGDRKIGLLVDEILDIRDILTSQIDLMPENFRNQKISGVIRDAQLVSMIGVEILDRIVQQNATYLVHEEDDDEKGHGGDAIEVVIFRLEDEEYAIEIEDVAEIIDDMPMTPVADAPDLVEGIINIRGQVVTVGSLHRRLNLRPGAPEGSKIVVCNLGSERIGFRVDGVTDVMGVDRAVMRPREAGGLFKNVLHLDDGERLVMLFDTGRIFRKG